MYYANFTKGLVLEGRHSKENMQCDSRVGKHRMGVVEEDVKRCFLHGVEGMEEIREDEDVVMEELPQDEVIIQASEAEEEEEEMEVVTDCLLIVERLQQLQLLGFRLCQREGK
jgi:hypothetical protein